MTSDIPVRTNYSAEEVGMIGWECESVPLNYHVATSNVIVEISKDEKTAWKWELTGSVPFW